MSSPDVASPAEVYRDRLALRRRALAEHARRDAQIAGVRLFVFAAGIAVAGVGYGARLFSPAFALLAVPIFIALVVLHERVLRGRDRAARAVAHLERGLARIEERWQGGGTSGARFADDAHLYAADLDLFGRGSLFELLCTARTRAGEARVAALLTTPTTAAAARARQEAVAELVTALDLREDVDVLAARVREHDDEDALLGWAARGEALPRAVLPAAVVLSAVSIASLALAWRDALPAWAAAVFLSVHVAFALSLRRRVGAALVGIERAVEELRVLGGVAARIETASFVAPRLVALRARFISEGVPPSVAVRRLADHLNRLRQRENQIFAPIAALLSWRTVHAVLIGRWRQRYGPRLVDWIDAIAELEALLSLSAYAYEHPEDVFPEICDDAAAPQLTGVRLGHPLLPGGGVRNDVRLGGDGPQLLLVSGSNMSGKSTYLRTVGVNVVLALAGGPVRAAHLVLTPMASGATLRVQDSLEKGASRFYAEIARLQAIVRGAEVGPFLFLIDELLAGTNSRDRQVGGAAILRGLVARGAIGLATTHDLALTEVAVELGPRARNVHFEDVLEGDRVSFDYVLRDGVVERSNALALMRAVGLDV